jgi:hypothetical protein
MHFVALPSRFSIGLRIHAVKEVSFAPMTRDFFDPTPEQQNLVLIDAAIPA